MISYGDVFSIPVSGDNNHQLNNGASLVSYGAPGKSKTRDATIKENPDGSGVAVRYDTRFDDPTYYGA